MLAVNRPNILVLNKLSLNFKRLYLSYPEFRWKLVLFKKEIQLIKITQASAQGILIFDRPSRGQIHFTGLYIVCLKVWKDTQAI